MLLDANASVTEIGEISELKGTGEVVRDTSYQAELKFGILSMDDVQTGNGRIKIDFIDGSELRITEQSKITIDDFVFDPDPDKGKMAVTFLSGTARFATSKAKNINQENISINTPTAQISVRGTDFTVTVDELGRSLVILLPDSSGLPSGEIIVATATGSVVLNQSYQSTVAYMYEQNPTNPIILDLTLDMIDNMLIVNPPREKRQNTDNQNQTQSTGMLTSSDLDVDFLEVKEEPQEIEFNRLDVDYLDVNFLTDIIDQIVEVEGLKKQKEKTVSSSIELQGTVLGADSTTGLITFVENGQINMSRDNNGKVQLLLDPSTSYNISFSVDGRTFNVLINGGESNIISIRQSK